MLCRNSRAVALAEPGLTASRLAGWPADKMQEFLKFIVGQIFNFLLRLTKLQHH